jgi:hypothetical protein
MAFSNTQLSIQIQLLPHHLSYFDAGLTMTRGIGSRERIILLFSYACIL